MILLRLYGQWTKFLGKIELEIYHLIYLGVVAVLFINLCDKLILWEVTGMYAVEIWDNTKWATCTNTICGRWYSYSYVLLRFLKLKKYMIYFIKLIVL